MIDDLKELLRCYEYVHDLNSPTNKEIIFWRSKFIFDRFSNSPNIDDVKEYFLCFPSDIFMNKSIEYWIEILKKV